MTAPIYKCWTKATNREGGTLRRSHNWITSRRAWFKIFTDRIECGDWNIPFAEIEEIVVYRVKQMLIPFTVLQIEACGKTYQFGFNPWAKPLHYLPISYREEQIHIKHSTFSIGLRAMIIFFLIYLAWRKFG